MLATDIAQHDPGFSLEAFASFAQALFLRINRARASGQFADVTRLLDPGVLADFEAEGPRPDRSKVRVDRADPVRGAREGQLDTVVLRFSAHATPGFQPPTAFVEDWTFHRSVVEPTPAATECPACGEPLALTAAGSCSRCGTPVAAGLGDWRLVQVAAPQDAPLVTLPAARPAPRGGRGCLVVALVAIPLLLVALPFVSVLGGLLTARGGQGAGPRVVIPTARPTPAPRVTGHVTLSGAVSQTLDTEMSFFSRNGGTSCRSQAQGFTGLFFYYKSADGSTLLTVSVYTPKGSVGPGTYQTSDVSVSFALTTGAGQEWDSGAGQTAATLVVRPDGSGTLSVTGLHLQAPPTRSVRRPLLVGVAFSCG
jgi:hypothetical protein